MKTDPDDIVRMFEQVSLGAPQNAIGFVLWRAMHRYVRDIDQALRPVDLTHLQFTILTLIAWMSRTADVATQAELARFGDIHPMQVSNVLRALEAKRLVDRRRATANLVAKQVTITSLGVSRVREALPLAIGVQQRLFGLDGGPDGNLLSLLRRVVDDPAPRVLPGENDREA